MSSTSSNCRAALATTASTPSLHLIGPSRSLGFDPLLTPARVLVYGPQAATDPVLAKKLAARAIALKQSMPARLVQRRELASAHGQRPIAASLPPRVRPPDHYRHLDTAESRSLVDGIRPIETDEQIQKLRKATREANIAASRSPFIPPSNSASSFVQLRRLEMERIASGDPYNAKGDFLKPSARTPNGKLDIVRTRVRRTSITSRGKEETLSANSWSVF